MDPFVNQPAEEIEAICKKLDNRSLAKFMETSKRVHNICYDMYLKRQEEYLRQEEILDRLRNEKLMKGFNSWVIYDSKRSKLIITINPSYLKPPDAFLIPEINIVGKPEAIRFYLANEGLKREYIDKLMKTAI